MTPEDAFLDDIREHPDDDAPRLIFADWLDDHGETDRAEFIRARVYRARIRGRESPEADELTRRASALLAANWQRWTAPLRPLFGDAPDHFNWPRTYRPEAITHFPRGFVESVEMEAGRFVAVAAELFRLCPIRHVHLHRADEHAARLAECPQLAWVEGLSFPDYARAPLGPRGMVSLAGSPHLGRLWLLWLSRNYLGDEGLVALAAAPWLDHLRAVSLSDNGASDRGAEALARTPRAFRPRKLFLHRNAIGDRGAIALAESPVLEEVRTLTLAGCGIGPAGAAALAGSEHLLSLEEIDLSDNPLTGAGEAIVRSAPWGRRARL